MPDALEPLILDLLEWIGNRERGYRETMETWRTSCPRLAVWEEASLRGLVETCAADGRSVVRLTSDGIETLRRYRPFLDASPPHVL
jgi:hypothetical protein